MNKSYLRTIAEFASEQFDMVGIFLFICHIVNIVTVPAGEGRSPFLKPLLTPADICAVYFIH